jgi:tetratricopeptide (TPR) repeat protein
MASMRTIPLRPAPVRLIIGLILAGGIAFLSFQLIRDAVGSSIMTFLQRSAELAPDARLEGAQLAARWAPDDPSVRYGAGGIYLTSALTEQSETRLKDALNELQVASRMSPEDYRIYLALARALDRSGETARAREGFETATRLAPRHFDPHWAFGNHLLRVGDTARAFDEFRAALASRPSALSLIFDYAWLSFNGDGKAIARALAPPDTIRSQFVSLLVGRDRVADALEIWRAGGYDKSALPGDVKIVADALMRQDHLADAYAVWYSSSLTSHPSADSASLLANGSFEQQVSLDDATPFLTWRIGPQRGLTILLEKDDHNGALSFRAGFDIRENVDMTIAAQTVPVKNSTAYVLSFDGRARELRSLSNPQVEIFDAGLQSRLSVSAPQFRNGDTDWTSNRLEFTTSPQTEAVTLRIRRPPCGDPPCPLVGRVWFDSFKLAEKR